MGVPHRNFVAYKSVSGHQGLRDDVNKDCFFLGHNIGAVFENYYPRDKFVGSRRFSNICLNFSAKPIVTSFIFILFLYCCDEIRLRRAINSALRHFLNAPHLLLSGTPRHSINASRHQSLEYRYHIPY